MVNMSETTDFHGLCGILCNIVSSFGHDAQKPRHMGQFFIISSMSAFMLAQYIDSYASSLVFCISMWFRCSCLSALSCSATGSIIILHFIAVLSMIGISSLNDQYACRSFCTSALVDDQPQSTSSDSMHMCSSLGLLILLLSVMSSDMSMHDDMWLMVMHMPWISSPLCLVVVSGQPASDE